MQQSHDIIFIHALRVDTIIGILEHERRQAQPLVIDIELAIAPHSAAQSDCIDDCPINYAEVRATVLRFAAEHHYQLLESFADQLANLLLQNFQCLHLNLSISKSTIFNDTDGCGIRIFRQATQ